MSNRKNLFIFAGIIIFVTLLIFGGFFMAVNSQKRALAELIAKLPTQSVADFEKEEALKRGYVSLPIPDPTATREMIELGVLQTVKGELDKIYSTENLAQRMKVLASKTKVIARGRTVNFVLTNGTAVSGRLVSNNSDRRQGHIITVNGKKYKMKSQIKKEYHHLFDETALKKELVKRQIQLRKAFYVEKLNNEVPLTATIFNNAMTAAHYTYEGTNWIPMKEKIAQNAKMRYDGYLAHYKKQVDALLDKHTFMGRRFKFEDLNVKTPLNP